MPIPFEHRQDWSLANRIWTPWSDVYPTVKPDRRPVLHCVAEFLRHAMQFHGDVAEFGVFRGVTARVMAETIRGSRKTLHLFDTFCGMPPTDPDKDNYWMEGDFHGTSVEVVHETMRGCDNYCVYEGLFQNTTHQVKHLKLCFAHIDADIYESVWCATDFVYNRMSFGGIILYDDYGDLVSQGAKLAVDEFFADRPEQVVYLPTKQAIVIKSGTRTML